jgi:voltage-gated potassium channel
MLDLLQKERKFLFGSIITEDGMVCARISFTLFTLFKLVVIICIFSWLIYQFEHPVNPKNFSTCWDALYFTFVTMTTVGFGDVTPISKLGRFLTVMMILARIGLIHWEVGYLIKPVMKIATQVETVCLACGLAFHDVNAGFCKRCGAKLPT